MCEKKRKVSKSLRCRFGTAPLHRLPLPEGSWSKLGEGEGRGGMTEAGRLLEFRERVDYKS